VIATLAHLVAHREQSAPDDLAYTFLPFDDERGGSLTNAQLAGRARGIAEAIREKAQPGDRALLVFPPGLDFVCAFLACQFAGVIAVPAYPPRSRRHWPALSAIAADCSAALALTGGDALPESAAAELRIGRVLAVDGLPGADGPETAVSPDAIAFLQYTSGSSGAPKGVMVTHANLLYDSQLVYEGMGHGRESVMVSWLPPYHDMGLIGGILQPLYGGFPSYLMAPIAFMKRPLRWVEVISQVRGTCSGGPNFGFDLCARKAAPEAAAELDLSCWAVAVNGAEPIRAETLDRFCAAFGPAGFRRQAFYPCYGLAEATLIVSGGAPSLHADPASPEVPPRVGCGQVLGDQQVAIVDPSTGLRVPPGEIGEIWVHGRNVAPGYWERPELTAEAFLARIAGESDGLRYLRTGDLGRMDGDTLVVTGRLKDLVIVAGRNHYPADLEATCAAAHAALRPGGGAAFSIEGPREEGLVIVHEVERGPDLPVDAVFRSMRQALADAHDLAPEAIALIRPGTLPRTTSGKVRRQACRDAFLRGELELISQWSTIEPFRPAAAARSGD
jgi:acyl-CoA synthetase (AMP-forming)/AMP-acid ligase II